MIPELDSSVHELEATIQKLEEEETQLFQSLKQTIGGMSDLRYGRFSNGQVTKQVLEGLQTVQETCESKR